MVNERNLLLKNVSSCLMVVLYMLHSETQALLGFKGGEMQSLRDLRPQRDTGALHNRW